MVEWHKNHIPKEREPRTFWTQKTRKRISELEKNRNNLILNRSYALIPNLCSSTTKNNKIKRKRRK